jgi:hypothetical protein
LPAQSDAYGEMLGWWDTKIEEDLAQRVTRRVSLGVELEESTAR